ncbi:MAG: AAA family ATPase, partial [Ectothiorhodospiraceae bacterium]|nr:AAA family ATPase [Ectothiorhodospiraceae bacterium]
MSLPVDAASWLRSIGLGQYAELFASERIDLDGIREVSDEQLRGLGIQSHAHRRKLMAEVETLRGRGMSQRSDAYAADFEHRHITVLFADIVGSTALWTALDSERLHDVMGRFWGTVDEIIEQHGGVIEKHIGDAVMATFGAPITHGDDPARAVHAALKIHAAMPGLSRVLGHPVEVHVGVASGDVVAGRLGKGARAQYAVLGQPVILAARLHDVAAAGETLVAESTWRAVAEQFRGAETDPVSLKGFSEPVSAWRVVHVHADRTDRPFVGREEEIGRVRDELEAARQIGQARVVYLRGEAGVGKTRLAEEAGRLAREQGFAVHATQVLDFGLGTGRGALARLTRSLLGIPAAADEATTRRRLREDLEIRRGLEAADEPFLEALLDLPLGERTRQVLDSLDAAGLRQGLAKVFGDLVEAAATVAPRMLVVEDLHWADRTTLQVIDHLCARTTSAPVLLLLTARLEDDPRIAADAAAVRRLDLPPLPPEHTRALAERLGDAHDPLIEECVIRSGGNPFYLEQLLRFSAETTSGAIPPTIRELVQARMDHLPETDKAVLRAAAVLGPEFPVDALHHVLDTDHVSCARLVSALLLLERDEGFAFGHTLIRESVYGTMASEMRRRLHLRAAQWFEPRNLPLHAEHLDRAGDPGAARAYLGASEWASERYRFRTAAELAGRGLALAGNEPLDRSLTWSLAHSRGRALLRLADYATAVGAFDLALGLAASADERYQGWMGRAQCLHLSDRYYESLAALDEAETSARATDRPGRIAETHTWRGRVFLALGEIEGCMRENTLAVSEAERSASDKIQAAALSGLGYACYQRGWMLS